MAHVMDIHSALLNVMIEGGAYKPKGGEDMKLVAKLLWRHTRLASPTIAQQHVIDVLIYNNYLD